MPKKFYEINFRGLPTKIGMPPDQKVNKAEEPNYLSIIIVIAMLE
jgi:hypothetical protein